MGERRGSKRQKSFLRGFVYFDKMRGVMSCLVRDFSAEGARIILSQTMVIPEVVKLHIPQRKQTLRARVQWRRSDEIELAFIDANSVAAPAAQGRELAKRVTRLEAEIAELRRTVKRLKRESLAAGDIEAA